MGVQTRQRLQALGHRLLLLPQQANVFLDDRLDKISAERGAIELDLDPKSPAGIARAEQQKREKSEREAIKAAAANAGKSDAEIMREVKAREEAADPANQ